MREEAAPTALPYMGRMLKVYLPPSRSPDTWWEVADPGRVVFISPPSDMKGYKAH